VGWEKLFPPKHRTGCLKILTPKLSGAKNMTITRKFTLALDPEKQELAGEIDDTLMNLIFTNRITIILNRKVIELQSSEAKY
jgi:hypothetical protein